SLHFSGALNLGHSAIEDRASKFLRFDDAYLEAIAALAGVGRNARFQLHEENRITRNRERTIPYAIRLAVRLAIVDLSGRSRIVWSRVVRGVVMDIGWV